MTRSGKKRRLWLVMSVFLVGSFMLGHGSVAEACISQVSGDFESAMLPAEECDSPVGLCTEGILGGDIEGEYDFTATAIYPIWPAEDPYLFLVVGESVIYTDDGELYSQDYGTMNYATGQLFNSINFTGGTEDWQDVMGSLTVQGTLNYATGLIEGSYQGHTFMFW